MSDVFAKLIARGIKDKATFPAKTQNARNWYRNAAKNVSYVNNRRLMESLKDRLTMSPEIGKMYLFNYDPKHKDTLPYYDRYPLIFPIEYYKDGFLGINLHYLPPTYRAKLMDALYETMNNQRYDKTTKLKISYGILKGASKMRFFKPCIKRYLTSHLVSKMMFVYPSEWDMALMLPMARWSKRTGNKVYADSVSML